MLSRKVVLERDYPYPPEKVWKAITDPKALSEWLMETDFQPYVGHRFTFKTKASPGFDGIVHCEVLTVDPPSKLMYSWQGGPMKKPTHVIWTLSATEQGTHLKLEHTGFEGIVGVGISVILGMGWKSLLGKKIILYIEQIEEKTTNG